MAGGNKQRDYISKEDASSPTITTEAILLSCITDAEEGRDVAVINIPSAFIQMRVEDKGDMAIIKIRGVLMDILVQIAPEVYKSYVTTDKKGTKQLLVQCQNAIYGTMVASLLYYCTISNLNCHANLNLQDCVESVPGHVESAKPSCCQLLCSVFKGYTSISLILIHSCCFISVLTNTASGKSGKRSPDPLQLPRFSHFD
jgi:hypothetical protein